MTTLDWPTSDAFRPAGLRWGARAPRSAWRAFFTGQRQQVTHAAERLRLAIDLPPCTAAQAPEREAFLVGLARSGDWVRLPHFGHTAPLGTLRGSPTVSGATAAGATTVSITGARAGVNLLRGSQALGSTYWTGSVTVTANTHTAPDGTVTADTITDSSGAVTQSLTQSVTVAADSATYALSYYVRKTSGGTQPTFAVVFSMTGGTPVNNNARINTDTGAALAPFNLATVTDAGDWWRVACTLANNGTNTQIDVGPNPTIAAYGATSADATVTGSAVVWGLQLERAAAASAYAGLPTLEAGDVVSVAGQLIQVAYPGASTNAGTEVLTVPLTLPLRVALSDGAAVSWSRPTGTFQLEADAVDLEYMAGRVQQGVTLQFTEVF